jgi:pantothenate kinase
MMVAVDRMEENQTTVTTQQRQQDVVPASAYLGSWEKEAAARIATECAETKQRPYMVAITGIPGSGKTISSFLLQSEIEKHYGLVATIAPHDGYHYPLEYLKTHFADGDAAIYRRGAPDTFDSAGLHRDLTRIRDDPHDEPFVKLPGFDHSRGDPEPDAHIFDRERHDVIICEGLYLLHNNDGWEEMASLFDLKIFIDQDLETCLERVKIRNCVIPGYTPEEIDERTEVVDRKNAETAMASKDRANLVVQAVQRIRRPRPSMTEQELEHITSAFVAPFIPIENHEHSAAPAAMDTDWMMDISSRPRSDSLMEDHHRIPSRPSTPGTASVVTDDEEKSEPPPNAAQFIGTWEPVMAERIKMKYHKMKKEKRPFMVALIGLPGGGKSVSSFLLASMLDEKKLECFVTPHDGYHYPLEYLKTQPEADDLIYRRGAPDTFDPAALHRDLLRIKDGDEQIIKLPAFNHSRGDPEPDTHIFDRRQHKIVLCEGLYLLHSDDGWDEIASIFDLTIFLNTPLEVCLERVKIRNQCIPGYTPEEIVVRTEIVDRANAMKVVASRERASYIVRTEEASTTLTVVIEENPSGFSPPIRKK